MQISRRSFLVGLGAGVFTELPRTSLVFAQETPHNLISVADYGAMPDGGDAGPGVRRAIAALPQRGGATLFFPPGRYHFRQSSGDAMLIEHIERLVLDGTGATLLFEGTTTPLRVRYCDSPLIHGFNIDSDRPQFSQGEVRAISPDARASQIRVNPEFPVTGHEQVQAVGTYASGIPTESREVDSFYPVKSVSLIDSQLLRLTFKWPQTQLSLGATVVLRHSMYDGCGIAIGYCRMPKLQNFLFTRPLVWE